MSAPSVNTPAIVLKAALALAGLVIATWICVSRATFVSGAPAGDDDPYVMAVSRNFDRLHAWPLQAEGPLVASISAVVETLNSHEPLLNLRQSMSAYLEIVRAAAPRGFPNDRIVLNRGFDESAAAKQRQAEEQLRLADLFIFDQNEDAFVFRPSHRAQLYHSQFIGRENTPLAALPAHRVIALEIDYLIRRESADAGALASRGSRLRLIWCDASGQPLSNDARWMDHYKLENAVTDRWIFDRIQDIAVPPQAKSVRLDFQLPPTETILIQNVRISGAGSQRESLPSADASIEDVTIEGGRRYVAAFPAAVSEGGFLSRSLVLSAEQVADVTVFSRDGSIRRVAECDSVILGRFHPHVVLLRDGEGRAHTLHVAEADAVRIERQHTTVRIICDSYLAADRSYEVYGRPLESGRRVVKNLGMTDRLPDASIAVTITSNGIAAFPHWQPHGRRATIIFTEHADRQTLDSDRVIMFGNPEGLFTAGEGLVGLDIPISKTVFAVPLRAPMDRQPIDSELWTSLEDADFEAHIRTLLDTNYAIQLGLHTAGAETDTIDITRPALQRLASLGGDLWIDHGDDHNLDCLRRLGWDPNEPDFYMIPDLRKAGVRYAWSYRDIAGPELNCIRDDEPANLIFEVPALADPDDPSWSLRLFATRRLEFQPELFSGGSIDTLIEQGGVCIVHCYFSFNRFGQIEIENRRLARWKSWFYEDMAYLARRRNEGDLHIPTVGEWIDFVEAVRQVEIRPAGNDGIALHNQSGRTIDGFTLAVMKPDVKHRADAIELSTGESIGHRDDGDRVVIWFDLPPGEHSLRVQWSGE